jgi:hypothetical protein
MQKKMVSAKKMVKSGFASQAENSGASDDEDAQAQFKTSKSSGYVLW